MGTLERMIKFSAALALAIAFAGTAHGKTLVFCANGSPEGFDPALHMAPATFDASAKPIYNRLIDFEPGSTKVVPSLAESWEVSPDGLQYTFHLRKGVKFQTTADFTPTRDFGADDVVFTFDRQMQQGRSLFRLCRRRVALFRGDVDARADQVGRAGRRCDGQIHADAGRGAVHRRPRHGFRLDPLEGICRQAGGGRQEGDARPCPDRHRAVPVRRLRQGRHRPLQVQSGLLGRQAGDR